MPQGSSSSARSPADLEAGSKREGFLGQVREIFRIRSARAGLSSEPDENESTSAGSMSYRTRTLLDWDAFLMARVSVWSRGDLWEMMFRLGLLSVCVALLVVLLVPDPEAMRVSKFTHISKFLNGLIGIMLGFYIRGAMARWYACVDGFLELMDAIRNLQMQFCALGLPDSKTNRILRYAYASSWLLYHVCLLETRTMTGHRQEEMINMWKAVQSKEILTFPDHERAPLLKPTEVDALMQTRDPSAIMWTWVAVIVARHSQDGWLPGMQTPTYGRIMNLCQDAHTAIRDVRSSVQIQSAFIYTHCLATLVHLNNILNAVTLGIVAGICTGGFLLRQNMNMPWHARRADISNKEMYQDGQNLTVTAMYSFLGPLLFQGLLLISMDLAQPFDSKFSEVPVDHLFHQLEQDMYDGRFIMENTSFERPYFKEPPPKADPMDPEQDLPTTSKSSPNAGSLTSGIGGRKSKTTPLQHFATTQFN